ncbi:urea ABC transporter permease subunit UrtB, partial [Pseudomonas quasicaspiana]|nr:urea ABC transporter permease subunit UrtB [Pseudomonas quasicaspiana]
MPNILYRFIFTLALLLPMAAQASDAGDFVAASSAQQAELLESWAAQPVPGRIELINALQEGRVAADSSKRAFIGTGDKYVAVDADTP